MRRGRRAKAQLDLHRLDQLPEGGDPFFEGQVNPTVLVLAQHCGQLSERHLGQVDT